jgi:hypothetical protein
MLDKQPMKRIFTLTLLSTALTGCVSTTQWARVDSPDRQACIIVSSMEQRGIQLPGPEPAETMAKWARFVVEVKNRKVYDTGFKDVGVGQSIPFAFDVAWAPDSAHVAYRSITTLCIVSRDGKVHEADILCTNSLISSFKWTSGKGLFVVVKEIDEPLDEFGYPQHYHGYLAKAKSIRILNVNLDGEVSECFTQSVSKPTFMFHSINFENQEMSPYSDRVAFSDGAAVCVYDDVDGKVIAKAPITGQLEGTWWETKDKLILGLGLMSSLDLHFVRFDLADGKIQDCTADLLPLWKLPQNWNYEIVDWFRNK